jgi:hypothetical protein
MKICHLRPSTTLVTCGKGCHNTRHLCQRLSQHSSLVASPLVTRVVSAFGNAGKNIGGLDQLVWGEYYTFPAGIKQKQDWKSLQSLQSAVGLRPVKNLQFCRPGLQPVTAAIYLRPKAEEACMVKLYKFGEYSCIVINDSQNKTEICLFSHYPRVT